MPTYLGWTVQTVPSSPVAPASLEVQHIPIVATTTNPFTGQQIVYAWQNGAAAVPPTWSAFSRLVLDTSLKYSSEKRVMPFS